MENIITQDDTSIVSFIHHIIETAIEQSASDIHFEPYENKYRIRIRIDGLLSEIATPPAHLGLQIASRLKVLAQCDIAEKRLPQDGRFSFRISKNIRVSTCPTLFGEKIVLRILDNTTAPLDIDKLGFEEDQKTLFLDTLQSPQGMILVTGPTGSGKTMTLFTALALLNNQERNIITIEDPVEIQLSGINQVNINPKAGLHFSTALRAFLRQDPDVMMIGEIRDLDTAELAINAAQTGHKILSTIHTNSAVETIPRLIHMGISALHLANTLSLVITQRLVRRLCEYCKKQHQNYFEAVGCQYCHQGYKGRIGVYEMMPLSENIGNMILSGKHSMDLKQQMEKENHLFLQDAALMKAKQGITSLSEIKNII